MDSTPDAEAFTIRVGATSFECRNGLFTTAITAPDVASGTVTADDISGTPADWAAPVTVTIGSDVLTVGEIVAASPSDEGTIKLSVGSARSLSETLMPSMVCQNVSPLELVYAGARSAGFADSDIDIPGLTEQHAAEAMWVLAPIGGVRVNARVRIGAVEFIDAAAGLEMLQRFAPRLEPQFVDPLETVTGFARAAVAARLLYDAEEEGVALLDTVAAWLTTRTRYSWSHTPDGALEPYERSTSRAIVERLDGVAVLAVQGQRRWWRATGAARAGSTLQLRRDARCTRPPMPTTVPPNDRHTLLALQRAASADDPIQRVAALWEAIEFYAGAHGPQGLFDANEVASIAARASSELSGPKARRVRQVLSQWLNQPSIMARLQFALEEDRVPLTEDDLALLRRLRAYRNRAVHGAASSPTHQEVDRGLHLMSRAMTVRWSQNGAWSPT